MKTRWIRALLVPVAVLAAACGDDDPAGPEDIAGTYTLESVGGQTLPLILDETEDMLLELLGSTLVIEAGGTYTETSSYRETTSGAVDTYNDVSIGSWDRSGTRIELTDSEQDTVTGTVSANRIVLGGGGFSIVYEKQ